MALVTRAAVLLPRAPGQVARGLRIALGIALLALTFLPVYRLLDPARTGLAGAATLPVAEVAGTSALWGTVIVAALSVGLAWLLRHADVVDHVRGRVRTLAAMDPRWFAACCAGVAFALCLAAALVVLRGLPSSVDEMVELLHARTLLTGRLALPLPGPAAAWMVQNSLLTARGWASIYPPLHTLVLAAGLATGAPWLVGPIMTAVAAAFAALSLERLMPHRRLVARCAALLCALSPFLLFLGATELSHTTALAFATLTLWTGLRARDGGARWAVATGLAVGGFVCTRPWTGMAVSAVLLGTLWLREARRRPNGVGWIARRVAFTLTGGLPFAVLLLTWNQVLFGGPFVLGYSAAFGPAHGLGFHRDPWGNLYGLREALAYTSADLTLLGNLLLESVLPATAVVGVALLVGGALGEGAGVLLAWGLAGPAANFVYWHHGIHMGPRFLFESGPAWIALWVVGIAALRRGPGGAPVRRAVGWAAAISLLAAPFLAAGRGMAYRVGPAFVTAARLPDPPVKPALVFVHGSWSSRTAARLVAAGMRRDSVETALRRNDACRLDDYARWRAGDPARPAGPPPSLDLRPLTGPAPGLRWIELSPGNRVAVLPGAPVSAACMREARSDRMGTLELEPLLWQAPPIAGDALVLARDLGPAEDGRVMASFPSYHAYVEIDGGPGKPPRLFEYDEGMRLLWSPGGSGD